MLYKQFLAWSCNGSSVAPISDYVDSSIFQELPDQEKYFSAKSNERIYLDLRASSGYVKEAEKLERKNKPTNYSKKSSRFQFKTKNLGILSLSKYLLVLSKSGLTLKRRTYTINQSDENFLEFLEVNK